MYLDAEGKLRPRYRAGAWAAGVPGTVRGLGLAHARFGKTPWAELVRPAARLAREGFPISADLAGSLNRQLAAVDPERRTSSTAGRFRPTGRFPRVGRGIRQARPNPVEGGRPLDPERSGRHARPDRRNRPRRVLHRPDCPVHRELHGGTRRLRHPRRPEILSGQAPFPRSTRRSAASTFTASAHPHRAGSSSARCSISWNATT